MGIGSKIVLIPAISNFFVDYIVNRCYKLNSTDIHILLFNSSRIPVHNYISHLYIVVYFVGFTHFKQYVQSLSYN